MELNTTPRFLILGECYGILKAETHFIPALFSRWKGENVSTIEVSNVVADIDWIEDANVYGVAIPGMFLENVQTENLYAILSYECHNIKGNFTNAL